MLIIFDVPDRLPANFENPSKELLAFVEKFKEICVALGKRYSDIGGRGLFSAFIRDGANSVFCTSSGQSKPILRDSDFLREALEKGGGTDDFDAPPDEDVFMDDDLPGSWVVVRLCVENMGSITLYSHHFEPGPDGKPSIAAALMELISRWLDSECHTVPRPSR